MRILFTGGSGDLASELTPKLSQGNEVIRLDICQPRDNHGLYVCGSILDREILNEIFKDVDCIIHIAAWHGYHELTKEKNVYDFWDLNVTGTFNVFQAAVENNINNIIHISTESVVERYGVHGHTKVLAEAIADTYFHRHKMNVITLRPRGFIPYWNTRVYPSFVEWAKWFSKGAVHIDDMVQAVIKSLSLINQENLTEHFVLPVDGKYEYTTEDLAFWDKDGPGSTFQKYYAEYRDIADQYGLNIKPTILDMTETKAILNYSPTYSLRNVLCELQEFGERGPLRGNK